MNHHLLCALGVGHSTLSTIELESDKLELAGKLTGAGGGGCAITFIPTETSTDTVEALHNKLRYCLLLYYSYLIHTLTSSTLLIDELN